MNVATDIARTNPPAGSKALFQTVATGELRWTVRTASVTPELLQILENPDACLPQIEPDLRRRRKSTTSAQSGNFFLKRYNHDRTRLGKLLKGIFRAAPAERAFKMGCGLIEAGVVTPLPVAFASVRFAGVLRRAYLITEAINETRPLWDWPGDRSQAARDVAALVAKLHQAGFLHHDLHLGNLLYDRAGRLFLVDLDSTGWARSIRAARTKEELALLYRYARGWVNPSRGTRGRFLREYCRLRKIDHWKLWWRDIERINKVKSDAEAGE